MTCGWLILPFLDTSLGKYFQQPHFSVNNTPLFQVAFVLYALTTHNVPYTLNFPSVHWEHYIPRSTLIPSTTAWLSISVNWNIFYNFHRAYVRYTGFTPFWIILLLGLVWWATTMPPFDSANVTRTRLRSLSVWASFCCSNITIQPLIRSLLDGDCVECESVRLHIAE